MTGIDILLINAISCMDTSTHIQSISNIKNTKNNTEKSPPWHMWAHHILLVNQCWIQNISSIWLLFWALNFKMIMVALRFLNSVSLLFHASTVYILYPSLLELFQILVGCSTYGRHAIFLAHYLYFSYTEVLIPRSHCLMDRLPLSFILEPYFCHKT